MSKKTTKRGEGRLYKRDKAGKEHPANSKVLGVFYLEFRVDGKRTRQRLTDGNGKPITDMKAAERQQAAILAPFRNDDKVEQLRVIQSKLQGMTKSVDTCGVLNLHGWPGLMGGIAAIFVVDGIS